MQCDLSEVSVDRPFRVHSLSNPCYNSVYRFNAIAVIKWRLFFPLSNASKVFIILFEINYNARVGFAV